MALEGLVLVGGDEGEDAVVRRVGRAVRDPERPRRRKSRSLDKLTVMVERPISSPEGKRQRSSKATSTGEDLLSPSQFENQLQGTISRLQRNLLSKSIIV